MLNNYNQKINLNTPATGIIQKSHEKSFFKCMHYQSLLADTLFDDSPRFCNKKVVIIQVMLIHENYIMLELIYEEDLEGKKENEE